MTTSTTPTPSENGLLVAAFLAALFVVIMLCGCEKAERTTVDRSSSDQVQGTIQVIKVRGCEYVLYDDVVRGFYSGGAGICHAGDCTNPIHTPCDTLR